MTPTLLEAAKKVMEWVNTPPVGTAQRWRDLEAAISAEEAKPKVERRRIDNTESDPDWVYAHETEWYAERPVPPPPKEPSIEDKLALYEGTLRDIAKENVRGSPWVARYAQEALEGKDPWNYAESARRLRAKEGE